MGLVVFTQEDCRYCGSVKNFLSDNDVDYIEIIATDKYIERYNLMGAPTVILFDGNEHEDEVARTTGFNPGELMVMIENME